MEVNEVLQALEELACRYEETARAIRAVRVQIAATEHAREQSPETDGQPVGLSEAIRQVLARADQPLLPGDVWDGIRRHRIALRTRAQNPRDQVRTTLDAMRRSGQVRKVPEGWTLA